MSLPGKYHVGTGGGGRFIPIEGASEEINLAGGSLKTDTHPTELANNESPDMDNARPLSHGVTPGHVLTQLGSQLSATEVLGMGAFAVPGGTPRIVRLKPGVWEYFDAGAAQDWAAIGGAPGHAANNRAYTMYMQDLFVAAVGDPTVVATRLKAWTGEVLDSVVDLSADAPRALFVSRLGTRAVAACIDPTGIGPLDPYEIRWSEDGDITGWTSSVNGAGGITLYSEAGNDFGGRITGLAPIKLGLLIFRDNSIMLATRTGIGAAPFRFVTLVPNVGTFSPYSIVTTEQGVFFYGTDKNIHLVDHEGHFATIGTPIHEALRGGTPEGTYGTLFTNVIGIYDPIFGEYGLFQPSDDRYWAFNVRRFMVDRKVMWRRANMGGVGITAACYGTTSTIAPLSSRKALVSFAGGTTATFLQGTTGKWVTKAFGSSAVETLVDRVYVSYSSSGAAQITLEISVDGGTTWTDLKTLNLTATGHGSNVVSTFFNKVVGRWQFRLTFVTGKPTIAKLVVTGGPRGRISA